DCREIPPIGAVKRAVTNRPWFPTAISGIEGVAMGMVAVEWVDKIPPMAAANPLDQISWLFHFTDSRNLGSIRDRGGLYSKAKLDEMGIKVYTGGNQWSLDADKIFGM